MPFSASLCTTVEDVRTFFEEAQLKEKSLN